MVSGIAVQRLPVGSGSAPGKIVVGSGGRPGYDGLLHRGYVPRVGLEKRGILASEHSPLVPAELGSSVLKPDLENIPPRNVAARVIRSVGASVECKSIFKHPKMTWLGAINVAPRRLVLCLQALISRCVLLR